MGREQEDDEMRSRTGKFKSLGGMEWELKEHSLLKRPKKQRKRREKRMKRRRSDPFTEKYTLCWLNDQMCVCMHEKLV